MQVLLQKNCCDNLSIQLFNGVFSKESNNMNATKIIQIILKKQNN